MASLNFNTAIERLLAVEKGYVNNPDDPGGETNWGISKRAYPNIDIKNLTRDGAIAIYKRDFWDVIEADILPSSVVYQLFDFAVNSGIQTAIRYFQRVLKVADDGYFGPVSKKAATEISECDMLLNLVAERLEFMTKLKNWPNAGKGWCNRLVENLHFAALDNME